MAVGTITPSISASRDGVPTQNISLYWVSDGSGNVSGTYTPGVSGIISRVTFVPAGGADVPSNLYDVTLLDEWGVDLLAGAGANRSDVTTNVITPTFGTAAVAGEVQLVVANAGAANAGTVIITLVKASASLVQTFSGDGLIHVTKTLTFTGAANLGLAASAITLFSLTGLVKVERFTVYCTVDGVSAASGTLAIGTADTTNRLLAATLATNFDAAKFVIAGTTALASAKDNLTTVSAGTGVDISTNIIGTVAVGDITAGTIVLDAWYRPITGNGRLVGD